MSGVPAVAIREALHAGAAVGLAHARVAAAVAAVAAGAARVIRAAHAPVGTVAVIEAVDADAGGHVAAPAAAVLVDVAPNRRPGPARRDACVGCGLFLRPRSCHGGRRRPHTASEVVLRAMIRLRMSSHDGHYGGGLVDEIGRAHV